MAARLHLLALALSCFHTGKEEKDIIPQTKAQINIKEKVVARFKGGKELLATLKSSMKDLKPLLQKKKKK
jgi:hypothetical protein